MGYSTVYLYAYILPFTGKHEERILEPPLILLIAPLLHAAASRNAVAFRDAEFPASENRY
jgi:hypothetical protein